MCFNRSLFYCYLCAHVKKEGENEKSTINYSDENKKCLTSIECCYRFRIYGIRQWWKFILRDEIKTIDMQMENKFLTLVYEVTSCSCYEINNI